jgi:hypothetical protein
MNRTSTVRSPKRCYFLHLLTLYPQLGEPSGSTNGCLDISRRTLPRTTNSTPGYVDPVRRYSQLHSSLFLFSRVSQVLFKDIISCTHVPFHICCPTIYRSISDVVPACLPCYVCLIFVHLVEYLLCLMARLWSAESPALVGFSTGEPGQRCYRR